MSAQLCHGFLPSQQMAMARWKLVMDFQMLLLWLLGIWMVDVKGQGLTIAEDDACLSGFKASVHNSENLLSSWSTSQGVPPCNGSISSWTGVTCDNNRVFSLMLPNVGLSGVISSSLSRCSAMNTLDLSANHMSGGIPPELGELSNLVSLNLSMNQLSGPIPTQISNCSYLNALDLHGNELDGPIPSELGSLVRLQVFDVSDNGLTGPIPSVLSYSVTGAPRFNASSFDGNKDLFGFPLPASNGHNLSVLEIVGIGFASGIFSLIVSFTAVCVWVKVSEQRRAAEEGRISELITDP